MASAFNLTAQLNLVGPSNIGKIVSEIKREIGTIQGNINFKIDARSVASTSRLSSELKKLNLDLIQTAALGKEASASLASLGLGVSKVRGISKISKDVIEADNATKSLGVTSSSTGKSIAVMGTEMQEFGRQSGLAIRRFVAFSAVSGIIYKLTGAISGAIAQFISFDSQMIKLSQVTGKSQKELASLVDEVTHLSTTLGVSSAELIEVASTLAQAGLSASDTEVALRALALSANAPSFGKMNDTVEGTIALMAQFSIEAGELEAAIGSINAVSAAFAVEARDIIVAIQRTGGVFAAASQGVSQGTDALNEFIAVFTSVRATTRESAETIATGLRTIFTRIQRGDTIDALREFGIELTDSEGKFVGAYKAVQLLSKGLKDLDPRDLRFSQIVEELGGFRQIGKVIPLIQQSALVTRAYGVAQRGAASLASDNATAQLALAKRIMKVKEEFIALIRAVGQNAIFKGMTDIALGLATALIRIASAAKGLVPFLTILAGFKGISAIMEFATGFSAGMRPKGGGKQTSIAQNIGQTAGNALSGAKDEKENQDLSTNTKTIEENISALKDLTDSFGTMSGQILGLSAITQQATETLLKNISALSENTSSITGLTTSINNMSSLLNMNNTGPSPSGPPAPVGINSGGFVRKFARGGVVPGQGSGDTVPAMLEPGEFVIRKKAVETLGASNLHKMNKSGGGSVGRYAGGGKIAGISKVIPNTTEVVDGDTFTATVVPDGKQFTASFRVENFDTYETTKASLVSKKRMEEIKVLNNRKTDYEEKTTGYKIPKDTKVLRSEKAKDVAQRGKNALSAKLNKFSIENIVQAERGGFGRYLARGFTMDKDLTTGRKWDEDGKVSYKAGGGKIQKFKDAGMVYPVDAIATYQNNSRDINTHLARPDDGNLGYGPPGQVSESDKAHIENIKETIKKLDSSPKTKVPDNVYTGIGETRLDIIKQQIGNQLASQKDVDSAAGSTFSLPGFLSTSKAKKIGMNFSQRAFLDIKTKKDATGIDVNTALPEKMLAEPHKQKIQETQREEQEFILPRSSSLKILKASANYNSANMSTDVPWTDPSYDVDHDPFYSMDIQQLGIGGVAKAKMAEANVPIRDMYRRLAKEGRLAGTGITDKDFVSRVPNKHDDIMNRLIVESFADEEAMAQKAIEGSEIFGLVGLISKTKHKSLGPEMINGKSIYTKIGILSEKTSASLQKQMEGVNASSTKNMAESIQAQEFLGSGKNLAIDFDDTLVSGADILNDKGQPDIEKYFDMGEVSKALQNAQLKSPIGTHLKEILEGDPKFIEKIRVLSARPQGSAGLIASTLTRLGIPIGTDRVTGVSTPGMTGEDVANAKAKNLGYDEALIDDNLQNILAARKANKTAHHLTPITPMSQEDLAITGKAEMEGYTIQQILTQLGAKAATKGAMSIDFPSGLGAAAQFFGMKDNIPTDVKRTIDSTSIGKYRAEVLSFLENRDGVFGTKGSKIPSLKDAVGSSIGASVDAKKNTQKSESVVQRNIGYIDSDVLGDPQNSAVVGAEMEKLGVKKVSDYKTHLSKLAAAARSGGSLERLSAIVGVAGSGKSSLMLGGSKSSEADNASLRKTTRSPILTPGDISSVSEIIDVTATVSPDRLSEYLTSADKVYGLESSTKEQREEIKRRRGSRDVTGNNLFGRSPGSTVGAPTDSGPMQGMLASEIDPKKLRTMGVHSTGFKLKDEKGKRLQGPTVETKKLAVIKGGFAPTTLGHESLLDAAKAMGFAEEDFVALVGSNEGITAKDPDAHDFRTVNFDQDFRTILAKAAFSKSIVNKADPGFGMPDIFEGKTGEDGRRHFVRPDYSGSVYMASGKTEKQLQPYKDKGYQIAEKKRTTVEGGEEEISATAARAAILSGDVSAMRKFLSPAVFDIVQKNLTQLQNREKVLPEIMAGVNSRKDLSLADIDAELANFPARLDRKKMEDDPAYKMMGDQVDALRERKKKIQSQASFEPFSLMRKLAQEFPEKYGLHLALGGEVYDLQKGTGLKDFEFDQAKKFGDTMGYTIPEFKTYLAKIMEQKKSKAGMKIDSKALLESLKESGKTSTPAQLALAAKLKGPSDAAYTPKPSLAEDMASVNRATRGYAAGSMVLHAPPPPPPPPPRPKPAVAAVNRPGSPIMPPPAPKLSFSDTPKPPSEHDVFFKQFLDLKSKLKPADEGQTRLYRVGDVPRDHITPETVMWLGEKMTPEKKERLMNQGRVGMNTNPKEARGKWFTDAPEELDFYINESDNLSDLRIYYKDVLNNELQKYNVGKEGGMSQFASNSLNHEREFVLDHADKATRMMGPVGPSGFMAGGMAQAQRFAKGGAASDTVPAMLTPGEFVINKKAAEAIGYSKLNKMNHADKAQGFARGGSVGYVQRFKDGKTVGDSPFGRGGDDSGPFQNRTGDHSAKNEKQLRGDDDASLDMDIALEKSLEKNSAKPLYSLISIMKTGLEKITGSNKPDVAQNAALGLFNAREDAKAVGTNLPASIGKGEDMVEVVKTLVHLKELETEYLDAQKIANEVFAGLSAEEAADEANMAKAAKALEDAANPKSNTTVEKPKTLNEKATDIVRSTAVDMRDNLKFKGGVSPGEAQMRGQGFINTAGNEMRNAVSSSSDNASLVKTLEQMLGRQQKEQEINKEIGLDTGAGSDTGAAIASLQKMIAEVRKDMARSANPTSKGGTVISEDIGGIINKELAVTSNAMEKFMQKIQSGTSTFEDVISGLEGVAKSADMAADDTTASEARSVIARLKADKDFISGAKTGPGAYTPAASVPGKEGDAAAREEAYFQGRETSVSIEASAPKGPTKNNTPSDKLKGGVDSILKHFASQISAARQRAGGTKEEGRAAGQRFINKSGRDVRDKVASSTDNASLLKDLKAMLEKRKSVKDEDRTGDDVAAIKSLEQAISAVKQDMSQGGKEVIDKAPPKSPGKLPPEAGAVISSITELQDRLASASSGLVDGIGTMGQDTVHAIDEYVNSFDKSNKAVDDAMKAHGAAKDTKKEVVARLRKNAKEKDKNWDTRSRSEQLAIIKDTPMYKAAAESESKAQDAMDVAKKSRSEKFGGATSKAELEENVTGIVSDAHVSKKQEEERRRKIDIQDEYVRQDEIGKNQARIRIGDKKEGESNDDYTARLHNEGGYTPKSELRRESIDTTNLEKVIAKIGGQRRKETDEQYKGRLEAAGFQKIKDPDQIDVTPFSATLTGAGDTITKFTNSLAASFSDAEGKITPFGEALQTGSTYLTDKLAEAAAAINEADHAISQTRVGKAVDSMTSLKGIIGTVVTRAGVSTAAQAMGGDDTDAGRFTENAVGGAIDSAAAFGAAMKPMGKFASALGTAVGAVYGFTNGLAKAGEIKELKRIEEQQKVVDKEAAGAAQAQQIYDISGSKEDEGKLLGKIQSTAAAEELLTNKKDQNIRGSSGTGPLQKKGYFGSSRMNAEESEKAIGDQVSINQKGKEAAENYLNSQIQKTGKSYDEYRASMMETNQGRDNIKMLEDQILQGDEEYLTEINDLAASFADGKISQEKLAEGTEEARKAAIAMSVAMKDAAATAAKNARVEAHTMKIAESFIASTPKEFRKQAEVAAQGEQLVAGTFDATSPNSALVKGQMKAMDEAKKSGMKGEDVTEAGEKYKADTINAAYTSAKENIMMKYGTLDSGEARAEQGNLLEKTFQAKGIDTNTEEFQKSSQGQMIKAMKEGNDVASPEAKAIKDAQTTNDSRLDKVIAALQATGTAAAGAAGGIMETAGPMIAQIAVAAVLKGRGGKGGIGRPRGGGGSGSRGAPKGGGGDGGSSSRRAPKGGGGDSSSGGAPKGRSKPVGDAGVAAPRPVVTADVAKAPAVAPATKPATKPAAAPRPPVTADATKGPKAIDTKTPLLEKMKRGYNEPAALRQQAAAPAQARLDKWKEMTPDERVKVMRREKIAKQKQAEAAKSTATADAATAPKAGASAADVAAAPKADVTADTTTKAATRSKLTPEGQKQYRAVKEAEARQARIDGQKTPQGKAGRQAHLEGRGVKTKGLGLGGKPSGGSLAGGVISMLGMGMLTSSAMSAVGMGDAGAMEHYAAQEAVEYGVGKLTNSKVGQAGIDIGKKGIETAGKYVPNVIKNIPGQASKLGTTALTKAGSYVPNVLKGGSTLGKVGSSALTTAGKVGSSALTTAGKVGSSALGKATKFLGPAAAVAAAAYGGYSGYNQAEEAGRSKAGATALGILTGGATVEKDKNGKMINANRALMGATAHGATLGSVVPVVGTAIGAGVGFAAELYKQETDPFGENQQTGSYITGKKGEVQEKTERMQKVKSTTSGNNLNVMDQTRVAESARLKLEMKDSATTDERKKEIKTQLEENRNIGKTRRAESKLSTRVGGNLKGIGDYAASYIPKSIRSYIPVPNVFQAAGSALEMVGGTDKGEDKAYMAEERRLMDQDPLEKARQDKAAQEAPYGEVGLSQYEQEAGMRDQQQTEERGKLLRTDKGLADQRNTASDDFEGQQTGLSGSERSRAQEHARLADELDVARSGGNEMEISKAQQQFDSSSQRGQALRQEEADSKTWLGYGGDARKEESDNFKNEVQAERQRRAEGGSLNAPTRDMSEAYMSSEGPDRYASMNGSDAAMLNMYGPAPGTENMHRSTTPAEAAQITAQLPLAANSVSKGGGVVESAPLPIDKMESGLNASFDMFVGKLEKINLPKIPDTVTMQGQHQVNVTINGADVLKNMGPEIQAMIATQIAMATRDLNKATEGGLT